MVKKNTLKYSKFLRNIFGLFYYALLKDMTKDGVTHVNDPVSGNQDLIPILTRNVTFNWSIWDF